MPSKVPYCNPAFFLLFIIWLLNLFILSEIFDLKNMKNLARDALNCFTLFSRKQKMSHTILLVQPNRRQDSRSYADFESVNEAMEGICKIYEEQLKKENSTHHSITYDIR